MLKTTRKNRHKMIGGNTIDFGWNKLEEIWHKGEDSFSDFFKFYLFDPYIQKVGGSYQQNIGKIFYNAIIQSGTINSNENNKYFKAFERAVKNKTNYVEAALKTAETNKVDRGRYNSKNGGAVTSLQNSDSNGPEHSENNTEIKGESFEYPLFLFSGWSHPFSGHAICILIEKNVEDDFSVFVINSGSGLQYHNLQTGDVNEPRKDNIIIKYSNVQVYQIESLIIFADYYRNRHLDDKGIVRSSSLYNTLLEDSRDIKYIADPDVCYYTDLKRILGSSFSTYKKDFVQYSDSCTVISVDYFLKYFIYSGKPASYDNFRKIVQTSLCTQFVEKLATYCPDSVLPNNNFSLQVVNIAHIILKDYGELFDRPKLTNILNKLYSNFNNSGIGEATTVYLNTKLSDCIQAYQTFIKTPEKNIANLEILFRTLTLVDFTSDEIKLTIKLLLFKSAYLCFLYNKENSELLDPMEMQGHNNITYLQKLLMYCDYIRKQNKMDRKNDIGYSMHDLKIIILTAFLSNFVNKEVPFNLTVDDIEEKGRLMMRFTKFGLSDRIKYHLYPFSFNYSEAFDKIILYRGIIYNKETKDRIYFFENGGDEDFTIYKKSEYGEDGLKLDPSINSYQKITNKLDILIQKINSDQPVGKMFIMQELERIAITPTFDNPNENLLFDYSSEQVDRTDIMKKNKNYGAYVFIKEAIRNLDKQKFLENLTLLPENLVDFILAFLYLLDDDFLKSVDVSIVGTNLVSKFLNGDIFCIFDKITDNTAKAKSYDWRGSTEKLEKGELNYFLDMFIKYDIDKESRLFLYIIDRQKSEPLEGYSISMHSELNKILNKYVVYINNKDNNDYVCIKNGQRFYLEQNIKDSDVSYIRTLESKRYKLVDVEKPISMGMNTKKIYNKLLYNKEPFKMWKYEENEDESLIYIDNTQKSYIHCINNDEIYYYDDNQEKYKLLTNYNALLGIWTFNMSNTFLIQNIKSGKNYVLLFMNKNHIHWENKNRKFYWYNYSVYSNYNSKYDYTYFDNKVYKLEISDSFLNIKTNGFQESMALLASLNMANNLIGLNLMNSVFLNDLFNDESIRKSMVADSLGNREVFAFAYNDTPLWTYYTYWTNFVTNNTSPNSDIIFSEVNKRIDYFPKNNIDVNKEYNISIKDNEKYKILNHIIEEVSKLSTKINYSKYTDIFSDKLKDFIDNFIYLCRKCDSKETISDKPSTVFPVDDIFQTILFRNKKFTDITSVYDVHFNDLYVNNYEKKFNNIKEKLFTYYNECGKLDCGTFFKLVEFLDEKHMIYSLDKPRKLQDIIFEIHTGFFLRDEQKVTLGPIYSSIEPTKKYAYTCKSHYSESVPEKAYEILMGRGKSSTLTPILLIYKYLHTNFEKGASIVLPSHLTQSCYDILREFSGIFVNKMIDNINGSSTGNHPGGLISNFGQQINNIYILSDNAYKINYLLNPSAFKFDLCIFDEIDSILNPLKSYLNMPIDKETQHDDIVFIGKSILDTLFKSDSIITNYREGHGLNIKMPNSDDMFSQIVYDKIDSIFKMVKTLKYNQDFGFDILNMQPTEKKKTTNIYDENQNDETTPFNSLFENKNGEGISIKKNLISYFIAIPYSANLTPVSGSKFSDYELTIVLTTLSYLNSDIRTMDVLFFFLDIWLYLKPYMSLKKEELILLIKIQYAPIVDIISPENILQIIHVIIHDKNWQDNSEINEFKKTCRENLEVLRLYLERCVFKYCFKIHKVQKNISAIDLFDPLLSDSKVSFSGTVNFHNPYKIIEGLFNVKPDSCYTEGQIGEIIVDNKVGAAIEASFYGITVNVVPKIMEYAKNPNNEHKLIEYLEANLTGYSSLIDCAGIILETSPLNLVKRLAEKADAKRRFLFVDENGKKQIYFNGSIIKYNNDVFDNLFIYYDHKNCVGMDFKQPNKMHGLVTISNKNTLTEISQGIYRLRNINIGHSIDFYCEDIIFENKVYNSDNSTKAMYRKLEALYKKLIHNEERRTENTKVFSELQCLKYIYRKTTGRTLDSIEEKIYYDLLRYSDSKGTTKYMDYNTFMDEFIVRKIYNAFGENLKKLNFNTRMIIENMVVVDNENTQVKDQEKEKEKEKEKEIFVQMQIDIDNQQVLFPQDTLTDEKFTYENYCDIEVKIKYNAVIPSLLYTKIYDFLFLTGIEWQIYISPSYFKPRETINKENVHDTITNTDGRSGIREYNPFSDYYIYYNKYKPKSVLILTFPEHFAFKHSNTSCKGLTVFNMYGLVVSGENIEVSPSIQLLFFKGRFTIYERFHILSQMDYDDYQKIYYIYQILSGNRLSSEYNVREEGADNYDFNVFLNKKHFEESKINNSQSWVRLFKLPLIDEEYGGNFYTSLITTYNDIYSQNLVTVKNKPVGSTLKNKKMDTVIAEIYKLVETELEKHKMMSVMAKLYIFLKQKDKVIPDDFSEQELDLLIDPNAYKFIRRFIAWPLPYYSEKIHTHKLKDFKFLNKFIRAKVNQKMDTIRKAYKQHNNLQIIKSLKDFYDFEETAKSEAIKEIAEELIKPITDKIGLMNSVYYRNAYGSYFMDPTVLGIDDIYKEQTRDIEWGKEGRIVDFNIRNNLNRKIKGMLTALRTITEDENDISALSDANNILLIINEGGFIVDLPPFSTFTKGDYNTGILWVIDWDNAEFLKSVDSKIENSITILALLKKLQGNVSGNIDLQKSKIDILGKINKVTRDKIDTYLSERVCEADDESRLSLIKHYCDDLNVIINVQLSQPGSEGGRRVNKTRKLKKRKIQTYKKYRSVRKV